MRGILLHMSKALQLGGVIAVIMSTLLLVGLILNVIDLDQFKSTLAKVLEVIAVLVLASIAVTSIARTK